MALSNCPQCNSKLAQDALFCSRCGAQVQTSSDTAENGAVLFTTKGLFKTTYYVSIIPHIILSVLLIVLGTIFGFGVGGAILYLLYWLLCHKWVAKQKQTYWSYVELREKNLSGLTFENNGNFRHGTSFTLTYADVVHLDTVGNNAVIIRTSHGSYSVQATGCADKVVQIIQQQKAAPEQVDNTPVTASENSATDEVVYTVQAVAEE